MSTALDESKGEKSRASLVGIVAKTGVYPGMAGIGRVKPEDGGGRRRRILGKGNSSHCYHVMSRTCGGEVLFDEVEREALAKLLSKMAGFCGVEVLTYCVMSNHFHALVRVPDREEWLARFDGPAGEKALLRHLSRFYSRAFMMALETQLAEDRRLGNEAGAQERLNGFKRRLCDVSEYVREVKLRYSKWFNKRHGRKGTLWMERFKSVLSGRASA
jgi:putative transposase